MAMTIRQMSIIKSKYVHLKGDFAILTAVFPTKIKIYSGPNNDQISPSSSDTLNNFFFKDAHNFCELLPYDITFVNITMDENGVLWLCRLHSFHEEPIVLRLCQIGEVN